MKKIKIIIIIIMMMGLVSCQNNDGIMWWWHTDYYNEINQKQDLNQKTLNRLEIKIDSLIFLNNKLLELNKKQ